MRFVGLLLLSLSVALAVTARAQAAVREIGVVPAAPGQVSAVVPSSGGGVFVVSAGDPIYSGPGKLTVDLVRPGAAPRRWQRDNALLIAALPAPGGALTLLVQVGQGFDRPPPGLAVVRVASDGRARTVWSVRRASTQSALARRGSHLAVAWLQPRRFGRPSFLWLARGTDGRGLGQARRVERVLPSWLGRADASFVTDLDVALDGRGAPTFGLTAWRRSGPQLVLATTTPGGRLRERQVAPRVDGLVSFWRTGGGRLALLAYDTGIEGERGECAYDGQPRQIWVALREPGALHFGAAQLLDSYPPVCAATGPRIAAGPGQEIGVAWGIASEGLPTPEPPVMRLAIAAPGEPFGRRAEPWHATTLLASWGTAAGPLFVGSGADGQQLQRRSWDGAVQSVEPLPGSFVRAGDGSIVLAGADGVRRAFAVS